MIAPSTARPASLSTPAPVFINRITPSSIASKDFGNSQNVLRARFLHSENKAVKLGPCPRPPQSSENSLKGYELSPGISLRGKDSRGNKEGSLCVTVHVDVELKESLWHELLATNLYGMDWIGFLISLCYLNEINLHVNLIHSLFF